MQRYAEVRKVLAPPYRNMSSEQIERMMESYNVNAEDMENFLSTLGNIGRSVVSALPQVLPAALPLVGTAIGGPVGGAIGGIAGQALGSVLGRQPGGARPPVGPGMPLPQMPGGSPAAGQLLQTIFQPQMLQSLVSMLLGQAGRQNIPVGRTQVPAPAFANLLGVLANQAASEASAAAAQDVGGESVPRYLQNYAGEAVGDPAIPEHRAYALLELLQEAQAEQDESHNNRTDSARESWYSVPELDEAYFDELELSEMYGEYDLA
jgi:hypothetical protein